MLANRCHRISLLRKFIKSLFNPDLFRLFPENCCKPFWSTSFNQVHVLKEMLHFVLAKIDTQLLT